MTVDALERFIASTRAAWGPLSSEVVAACERQLKQLLDAPQSEPWLSALHRD